jgi:hypothetical protein
VAKEPVEELEQETPEPEIEETEDQVQEPEAEEPSGEPEQPEDEGEEEVSIGFEDEPEEEADEADDTPTIKRIRERNRDLNKQLRDREKELAELRAAASAPQPQEIGPKPTLESCDWDEERFETSLDDWKQKKAAADEQVTKAQESQRRVIESYNRDLENYEKRKAAIGVPDYEDAEAMVVAALSLEQQAVALQAASDPAALVVALAKSPSKLAELAKIDNPWKLSAAIAKLEGSVKVVTKKKAPNIDKPAKGSAAVSGGETLQAQIDRLEAAFEKKGGGDRTEIQRLRRQLKEQAK